MRGGLRPMAAAPGSHPLADDEHGDDGPAREGATAPATLDPDWRWDLIAVLTVAALGILAMWPTLDAAFLPGDDEHFVQNHSLVNHPTLPNLLRLFTVVHRDLYQPIPMVSFAVDTALYGRQAWGFHLTNVLVHALTAAALWCLIRCRWQRRDVACLAAALFAVHPQSVEAVASVTGRFMQVGTLFSLLSVLAMLRWSRTAQTESGWLAASILSAVLAMTSKVQPALPVLLLLIVYGKPLRGARDWWAAWGTVLALTVAMTLLGMWTTAQVGFVASASQTLPGNAVGRALMAMGIYLTNLVHVTGLSPWYLPPVVWSWADTHIWVGAAGLAVCAAVIAWSWRSGRTMVAAGLVWYLVALLPLLGASSARNLIAADRYTYLANMGLFLAVAALVATAVGRLRVTSGRAFVRWASVAVSGGVLVILVASTWAYLPHYRDGLAMYERVRELYPDAPWVRLNVGWELARRGQLEQARDLAQQELDHEHGDPARAHHLLGWIEERAGRLDEAAEHYELAVSLKPGDPGMLYELGRIRGKQGRSDEARALYEQALAVHSQHLPSLIGLAKIETRAGDLDAAGEALSRALAINPQHVDALTDLGTVRLQQGRRGEAEALFRKAIEIEPAHVRARTNLAVILAQSNRQNEALSHYDEVLAHSPHSIPARLNRAALLQGWGQLIQAQEDYKAVLSVNPGAVPALEGWQDVLLKTDPENGPAGAARIWSVAVKHAGPRPDLLGGLAWAQALAGQVDGARTNARKALQANDGQIAARLAKVLTAMRQRDVEAALAGLDRACADRRAAVAEHLDRTARAIGAYGMRHPDEPLPYLLTGRIMLARGQTSQAMQAFAELKRVSDDPVWEERIDRILSGAGAASRPATRPATATSGARTPSPDRR